MSAISPHRVPASGRRIVLLSLVSLLLVLGVSCGGRTKARPTPTVAPTTVSIQEQARRDLADLQASKPPPPVGVDALTPEVKAAVLRQPWYQDGLDAREKQLIDFLVDAGQNLVGVRADWPYVTHFDGSRFVNTPFDAATEAKIVNEGLYDFIPMQKGTVVVVFSSGDVDLKRKDIEPVLAGVRKYLPQVEAFVGHPFRTSYLHVQVAALGAPYDASIQRGSNVFLDANVTKSKEFDFILAHELTHTYMDLLPSDARPWLREGMADLVSGALTNTRITGYTQVATKEPLPVDVNPLLQPGVFSNSYNSESGNGSLFLFEVLDTIGPEAMSRAVALIHDESPRNTRHANDFFDMIRSVTPPDKLDAVNKIIEKWTVRKAPTAAAATPAAAR